MTSICNTLLTSLTSIISNISEKDVEHPILISIWAWFQKCSMPVIEGMALIGIEKHSKSSSNYFCIILLMYLIGPTEGNLGS